MSKSTRKFVPLHSAEGQAVLEQAKAQLKPVNTIYRWVDAETQNVVFGTRTEWEAYIASR